MRRRKQRSQVNVIIDPNAVYDRAAIRELLQVSDETLTEAVMSGQLRYATWSNGDRFLGSWVLAWIEAREGDPAAKAARGQKIAEAKKTSAC